nr:response regulator [Lachnospiraceae bacterium]
MNLELIENVVMLLAVIIGLLGAVFRYFESQNRSWLYIAAFFLASLLSAYYWTVYSLVMGTYPDVSAFAAYLGWNIAYPIILVAVLNLRQEGVKGYINPLMFLPIPLNLYQLYLYLPYGGLGNNLWQGTMLTAAACVCLQSILYYIKNRGKGAHFPYLHTLVLIAITGEYGMWTASCFDWPSEYRNPYYLAALVCYTAEVLFAWGTARDSEKEGAVRSAVNAREMEFLIILQTLISFILLGGCIAGYYLAGWMKSTIPEGSIYKNAYTPIVITLFIISLLMDVIVISVIFLISIRHKNEQEEESRKESAVRSRFNLIFTLLLTLFLMVFVVIYTSRHFYRVSVVSIEENGEDKAKTTAIDLANYLTNAMSTLRVTADTVDLMLKGGQDQETICRYIVDQTTNQKEHLDENFTGLYGYIRGEYMDGIEWVPPDDYEPTERDWYKMAIAAGGETIIIPPYVDAQSHSVVITICQSLSDGKNVVGLDVIVNHIQDVTELIDVGGKGYGLIVDRDGLIIAHSNKDLIGGDFDSIFGQGLMNKVLAVREGTLWEPVMGEPCTLFVSPVMDQWFVVIAVTDKELYEDLYNQLTVTIIIFIITYSLISFFYYLGYRNERAYGRKVEEMNATRQKQEYEAQVLKLEKFAADEANKAKSSFLADMSHEIRTPINAILGMNEMIGRESDSEDVMEYSRSIDSSGRKLLRLINTILDFSKIEDGKMEIVPVRYSTKELITYLINSIAERAEAKGLEFKIDIDPTLPSELRGDDVRINQVIMNLLTNAVKYTHEGSVTLRIRLGGLEEGKACLSVFVEDTGIGIKEEDMDRLFESFERLDVVRNRTIEGTGLGMSIATKLLNLMGSELKVDSKYGEGSNFYFDLWQKIEDTTPIGSYEPTPIEHESTSYKESFRAPDARVLIVDDTRMNITVAVGLLKKTDLSIDTAMSGPEAIGMCERNDYDVILMDQRMPGMDGTQALKEIRALGSGRNHDTPVICLTADAIRGARERYLSEGFSDYLTKPVTGGDLERMLLKYLPEDKVTRMSAPDEEDTADDSLIEALSSEGIDTAKGL